MPLATAILFYLAIVAYVGAALLSFSYVRRAEAGVLAYAKHAIVAGNILLLLVFALRWRQWGLLPLTGLGDSLNLFLILTTAIILLVQRDERMRPLLCYYMPALALLALVSAAAGRRFLNEAPVALEGIPLMAHVGLIFTAFALFYVASLTSMAYALQARQLKRRNPSGFSRRLPSLERLDRTLFRLIAVGYPLFLITLVLGFLWAWFEPERLGAYWYLSPRIVFSFATAVFFGVSLAVRRTGALRGPKLAYLVFFGFAFLLVALLAMGFMDLGGYNFWDKSS